MHYLTSKVIMREPYKEEEAMKTLQTFLGKGMFAVAVLGMFVLTEHTFAGSTDEKSFRATLCNTVRGNPAYTPNNGIHNIDPEKKMAVYCPIGRDSTSHSKPLSNLVVYGKDFNQNADITCQFHYYHLGTRTHDLSHEHLGNNTVSLSLGGEEINPVNAGWGSYHVHCSLPPHTGIKNIWYEQ